VQSEFDYIVVGGGSAGCVVARRLSDDPNNRVLLVEAGPEPTSPYIGIPMGIGKTLANPRFSWYYPTEPEYGTGGSARVWLRGKVLGGSSAVNGMVYTRGHPQDYDDWEAAGADGWGWDTFLKSFMALEDHELGANDYRGVGGPLHVSIQKHRSPLTEAILESCAQLGTPVREDVNHPEQRGIGYSPLTIKNGRRISAYDAFLRPVRKRPNLQVITEALVERVTFEGLRASGIALIRGDKREVYKARKEVILSAGTLGSPRILQVSGVGPASLLAKHGIPVIVDRGGVGENLSEHKAIWLEYKLRQNYSHNLKLRGWRLPLSALQYFLFRSGPMATSVDLQAFIHSRPNLQRPDAQLQFWSLTARKNVDRLEPETFPAVGAGGWVLRPESRGSVMIQSADVRDLPIIRPNFLACEEDKAVIIGLFRYIRSLFEQPGLRELVDQETLPGRDVQSDEQIIDSSLAGDNGYHATGTCRMGSDDEAVVDPRLRVKGVSGLRVVDCSVMPTQVSSGVNGPVMALAWNASNLILEDARQ